MFNMSYIRESIIDGCTFIYNKLEDSAFLYFLREKYANLTALQKKIIYISVNFVLLAGLLYYPVSGFYSSYQHIRTFTDKKQIIQQLSSLSFALQNSSFSPLLQKTNVEQFIKNKMGFLQIPKKQVIKIQKIKPARLYNIKTANQQQDILIKLKDLNVQEIVQYGYRLENLSSQFKLTGIQIEEDAEKKRYFNVSYTIAFFSLTEKYPLSGKKNSLTPSSSSVKKSPSSSRIRHRKTH